MELHLIPTLFGLPEASQLSEISAGHINRTFLAVCGKEKYILQSLNSSVFHSPEAVMDNISRIEEVFSDIRDHAVPHFIACGDKNYAVADGELWRIYRYITATADAAADAAAAGRAFGTFIRAMDGHEPGFTPAIDDFHDFDRYFTALSAKNCVEPDIMKKLSTLRDTLGQVFTGTLKKRMIHGDAKPDNIIISETPTIIDLDTVMYGYAAIDYGDLVRSVCRGKSPDIRTISDITEGFSHGLDGILTAGEVESLYYGILWLTGELAVRYLTDSISEVKYFRGKSSADCRARADELLCQLDMFTALEQKINEIIYTEFN